MSKSSSSPGLDHLQHWMQGVITEPAGVEDVATIDRRLTPSATLTGAERLAIYQRSYRQRLLETLRGMLPVFRATVGPAIFDRFALDYLERHPPRSYTLARLADDFPSYLEATRPDGDDSSPRSRWSAFLVELATLELLLLEVYDGPGFETETRPTAADVAALGLEALAALRPAPAPCLQLRSFDFPVHRHLLAVRRVQTDGRPEGSTPFPIPGPEPSRLAITRRQYRVRIHPLDLRQWTLLGALDGSRSLDRAVARASGADGLEPLTRDEVRRWLMAWADQGFLAALGPCGVSLG